MIDSVVGSISDAPMPSMIASPTIRLGMLHESAASNEPPPKSAAPMMKMRRCPNTSARRPPMMSSAREGERVAGDDPLDRGQRGVEVAQDRGDRDVEHRVVEHHDERGDDDDRERDPAARIGDRRRAHAPMSVTAVSRGLSPVDDELGSGGVRVVVGHQPQRELRPPPRAARSAGGAHRWRRRGSSRSVPPIIGVSMIPGWIELTLTPCGPSSIAAPLVMPRTAHFVAA